MRGRNAGGLLVWLLHECKTDWITASDEETAARRLREHFNGPDARERDKAAKKHERHLSSDEQTVEAVLRVARQHRISDPFRAAQQAKGWTRARWDEAHVSYQRTQMHHWHAA